MWFFKVYTDIVIKEIEHTIDRNLNVSWQRRDFEEVRRTRTEIIVIRMNVFFNKVYL